MTICMLGLYYIELTFSRYMIYKYSPPFYRLWFHFADCCFHYAKVYPCDEVPLVDFTVPSIVVPEEDDQMFPAGLLLRQSVSLFVETQPQCSAGQCSAQRPWSDQARLLGSLLLGWNFFLLGLALVCVLKGTGLCTRCLTASKCSRKERTIPGSKSKDSF